VDREEQPFERMREAALTLAASMDGQLMDHQGVPLGASALDEIAADLIQLYDNLARRELSAGSSLARRLFS
jgi:hypothetical protein